MKSKTVLVTGGAGFIGSHVVERLLADGHKVVVVDDFNDYYSPIQKKQNLSQAIKNKNFKLVRGDIRSADLINALMKNNRIESVIHLAARAGVRPSLEDPKLYWDTNVMGTLNILEAMVKHQVKHLVFASSSSVYGNRDRGPFKETDNTDQPVSPYGASKKAMEALCYSFAHVYGIKTVGLRFFTVYGPRNRPDMACYLFTDAVSHEKALDQFGDGKTGRDYTYVADIVEGIIHSWQKKFAYEIFNLGNSSPVLLKDLIKNIETVVGKKAKIKKQKMSVADVKLTFADISKAKRELGWTPKTSIKEGLRELSSWYNHK